MEDLKKIKENYKRVEHSIALKLFYQDIKEPVLNWAKHYQEHRDRGAYLFDLLRNVMIDQKLSRLQAYALIGLVDALIDDAGYRNDEIDAFIDNSLFSRIHGDGDRQYTFTFPDDPPDKDPQQYAWSNEWKFWQGD